jgi:AraC family transcriptional regulator of arabinose operon
MDQRVQSVIAIMRMHLHNDLSLEELSRSVNLSSSRLRHLFKAESGVSPVQYLKSCRMKRAKELIETTFLNVKQIMDRVGVRDKRHFTEDFKKAYGLTPARYRMRHLRDDSLDEKPAANG